MNSIPYIRTYVFGTYKQLQQYIAVHNLREQYEGRFQDIVEQLETDYGEKLPVDTLFYIGIEPNNIIFIEGILTQENYEDVLSTTMDGRTIDLTSEFPEEDTDEMMANMFGEMSMKGGKKKRNNRKTKKGKRETKQSRKKKTNMKRKTRKYRR